MYGKPSRRLISRVFERGSVREPFLSLIITPKSIFSCPGLQAKQRSHQKVKTIFMSLLHVRTNRGTDACLLLRKRQNEEKTHREKITFNFCKSKSYLHLEHCYLTHSLAGDSKPHFN